MSKLVTIGIPMYKRFEYLPRVLEVVASQDYPNIDLLVSDNGMNGTRVREMVDKLYPKPYRFRQNPSTVGISDHFSQLVREARGEYFVPLADDDEISPNYVSDLAALLDKHPQASVAFGVQESFNDLNHVIGRSKDSVPELMSGPDFVRAMWGTCEFGFHSLSTYLARTKRLIEVGCYPAFWVAQFDEDAMIVNASIDNFVAFSTRSTYRKRYHESADQNCLAIRDVGIVVRQFLKHVDTDPILVGFASTHPAEWAQARQYLIDGAWRTYYYRWTDMYKSRMPTFKWVIAAFALPFIPSYYKAVGSRLTADVVSSTLAGFKQSFPDAYQACRRFRARIRKPAWGQGSNNETNA
jgi:glycosyltransferase involved in cell wall biosynthesis